MIVRILGEGQWEVPDDRLTALDPLDDEVEAAVEAGDEAAFVPALAELLARVRQFGTRLPDDTLTPSGLVLPDPDATLAEVRALLSAEGLIPG